MPLQIRISLQECLEGVRFHWVWFGTFFFWAESAHVSYDVDGVFGFDRTAYIVRFAIEYDHLAKHKVRHILVCRKPTSRKPSELQKNQAEPSPEPSEPMRLETFKINIKGSLQALETPQIEIHTCDDVVLDMES